MSCPHPSRKSQGPTRPAAVHISCNQSALLLLKGTPHLPHTSHKLPAKLRTSCRQGAHLLLLKCTPRAIHPRATNPKLQAPSYARPISTSEISSIPFQREQQGTRTPRDMWVTAPKVTCSLALCESSELDLQVSGTLSFTHSHRPPSGTHP